MYYLGQACGIISAIVTVVMPLFKKKEQILICAILVNGLNALNFAFIGQLGSSVYLCLVAIVQSLISIYHLRKNTDISMAETILFLVLYLGFGFYGMISAEGFVWAINSKNLLELLPIVGALMLMISVFAKGEQKTRLFIMFNGSAWAVYSAIVGSTVFFTASIAVLSNAFAMWKYRKR